ncbi:MAG: putative protein kinase UbiB [Candidatus Mesenet longicola]|uniref:Protein kinase domain-containing protein n=1 Tax=Candidatus Mesenet longicola TaxID=1892558 RepID=A0A8J3HV57_9RICK|nr:MAG: putative protein kinase UbiB [Candidatus Mesenet longicola]GHM59485.1 MAG: putative protein kinase UbiB [Candidatus Mesenet longicola]
MIRSIIRFASILIILIRYNLLFCSYTNRSIRNTIKGNRIKTALQKLGPIFIKFGQSLSARIDILGEDITNSLLSLCDKLPPFSYKKIVQIIESEFNCSIDSLFLDFSEEPVAAASIAQVHKAVTKDGKLVAVKVLRPNIEKTFSRDIKMLMWLASLIQKISKKSHRFKPMELVKTFSEICRLELDLRFEAANASELKENMCSDEEVYIPKVDWSRTSRHVLTLEWIDATPIYEIHKLNDCKQVAENLITLFCNQVYRDCFFHADMHPGNLMVTENNKIVMVDFGIMGRIDRSTSMYVAEIIKGFVKRDYSHVAKIHFQAGYVSEKYSNFITACRAIGEPIVGREIENISFANLLTQLFKITADFNMDVQLELLLLQKTMILVEGICRRLHPSINVWQVVQLWIEKQENQRNRCIEKMKESCLVKTIQEVPQLMKKLNRIADNIIEQQNNSHARSSKTYLFLLLIIIAFIILRLGFFIY